MRGVRFSIVIATKDRAAYLERALDSLMLQCDAPSFEVIVADNGSTDETAALAEHRRAAGTPFELTRLFVPEPNRGKARNAGIDAARGEIVLFIDDDVWVPAGFLAAHSAAHDRAGMCVNGPIINVPSYEDHPKPATRNYSGAFLCTCNASVSRDALVNACGFDERFNLYGWEDTDLGLRLRRGGVRRTFAWDAYLYHIKPPEAETLEVVLQKTMEKARMAACLLEKDSGVRARLATGAYALNFLRAHLFAPEWLLPMYAGIAHDQRFLKMLRVLARGLLLDGAYANELRRALRTRMPK
jgi:glycosyltransferase involved in cell wall biosynthesis